MNIGQNHYTIVINKKQLLYCIVLLLNIALLNKGRVRTQVFYYLSCSTKKYLPLFCGAGCTHKCLDEAICASKCVCIDGTFTNVQVTQAINSCRFSTNLNGLFSLWSSEHDLFKKTEMNFCTDQSSHVHLESVHLR